MSSVATFCFLVDIPLSPEFTGFKRYFVLLVLKGVLCQTTLTDFFVRHRMTSALSIFLPEWSDVNSRLIDGALLCAVIALLAFCRKRNTGLVADHKGRC